MHKNDRILLKYYWRGGSLGKCHWRYFSELSENNLNFNASLNHCILFWSQIKRPSRKTRILSNTSWRGECSSNYHLRFCLTEVLFWNNDHSSPPRTEDTLLRLHDLIVSSCISLGVVVLAPIFARVIFSCFAHLAFLAIIYALKVGCYDMVWYFHAQTFPPLRA